MATMHLFAAALLCLLIVSNGQGQTCERTPANFRSQYITNCEELLGSDANCTSYWDTFASAFAGINPGEVTANNYNPYFALEPFRLAQGPDTTLFWSQTPELVNMLSRMSSGTNVVSSFNSPGTAIVNSVDPDPDDVERIEVYWCGTTNSSSPDGIDYTNPCPCSVTRGFFQTFSELFAQAARGTVFYLAYGERQGGTYNQGSFFALSEIPNLNRTEVRRVVVLDVHRNGSGESCGEGTLVNLTATLRNQLGENLVYTCVDLYGDLRNDAQVSSLTECAMNVISTIQNDSEPASSMDCSSALAGVQLSLLAIAVALVIAVFA